MAKTVGLELFFVQKLAMLALNRLKTCSFHAHFMLMSIHFLIVFTRCRRDHRLREASELQWRRRQRPGARPPSENHAKRIKNSEKTGRFWRKTP